LVGAVIESDFEEFIGVNNHQDLIQAEKIMRKRLRITGQTHLNPNKERTLHEGAYFFPTD